MTTGNRLRVVILRVSRTQLVPSPQLSLSLLQRAFSRFSRSLARSFSFSSSATICFSCTKNSDRLHINRTIGKFVDAFSAMQVQELQAGMDQHKRSNFITFHHFINISYCLVMTFASCSFCFWGPSFSCANHMSLHISLHMSSHVPVPQSLEALCDACCLDLVALQLFHLPVLSTASTTHCSPFLQDPASTRNLLVRNVRHINVGLECHGIIAGH